MAGAAETSAPASAASPATAFNLASESAHTGHASVRAEITPGVISLIVPE